VRDARSPMPSDGRTASITRWDGNGVLVEQGALEISVGVLLTSDMVGLIDAVKAGGVALVEKLTQPRLIIMMIRKTWDAKKVKSHLEQQRHHAFLEVDGLLLMYRRRRRWPACRLWKHLGSTAAPNFLWARYQCSMSFDIVRSTIPAAFRIP
jgi:hypothetical protein